MCIVLEMAKLINYVSNRRNSCRCSDTLTVVVARGLVKLEGFTFGTGVVYEWGVKGEVGVGGRRWQSERHRHSNCGGPWRAFSLAHNKQGHTDEIK